MSINYHRLRAWQFNDVAQSYTERDVMAYALSLGAGSDPLDPMRLPFIYEGANGGLRTLPTFALVLGYPGFWMSDPATGIDASKIVHGENGLVIHNPLPPSGRVIGRSRVTRVVDKGAQKGAIVTVKREITDASTGMRYATIRHVTFCRADGGFSAHGQPTDEPETALPQAPERAPDLVSVHPTRPETALLYRLNADPNPLHADPEVARAAGFDRPILHGLASYAAAGFLIVRHFGESQPERLKSLDVRFTAPMFPGEDLELQAWREGDRVHFRARVPQRDVVVLNCGVAEIQ